MKTKLVLVVAVLMILSAIVYYVWNERIRPQTEKHQRQQEQLAKSCQVHEAARDGDLALLQSMYQAGCSFNSRDGFGMTPLHLAKNDRVAQFLISKGASVDAKDGRGFTPIQVMKMSNRQDVVDILRKYQSSK